MKGLNIKQKILLLTVLPLLLVVSVLMAISIYELRTLGDREIAEVKETMMSSKEEALKSYVDIVVTAIRPILQKAGNSEQAIEEVKDMLRSTRFGGGSDGYIFVYGYDGTVLAHGGNSKLEGRNLIGLKGPSGRLIVAESIDAAKSGGGYVSYMWQKPSKDDQLMPKLGYMYGLDNPGWMIGTGFYIDDIDETISAMEAEIQEQISTLMIAFAVIGLLILLVFTLVSLNFANRSLVRPIQNLAESARQMSLGKMDTVIDVESNDEIGELAEATKRMQKSLKLVFKKLKQAG